ncbi:hypothetical protein V8E54_007417 [Elaphomyces granulatus]
MPSPDKVKDYSTLDREVVDPFIALLNVSQERSRTELRMIAPSLHSQTWMRPSQNIELDILRIRTVQHHLRNMENQQSALQGETSITLSQSFLQLPYEIRCNKYRDIGVIRPRPIFELEWWVDKNGRRVPPWIPKDVFYTSEEVSTDALSVFFSENTFELFERYLWELLSLGNPYMWSSLRDLTVELCYMAEDEKMNTRHLCAWRKACIALGAHLPPSRLTLCVWITNVNQYLGRDSVTYAKNAFASMLELPLLKKVRLKSDAQSLGVHRLAIRLLKRLTCSPVEWRFPFRFMDLPVEIQHMILEHAGLVAPGPVTTSTLKGYALDNCCQGYHCYYAEYDSSQACCWSLPAELFVVNRYISAMSAKIFFSRNEFVVDVRRGCAAPVPNGLIWSPTDMGPSSPKTQRWEFWHPKDSKFLMVFPPACIPMLTLVTWRFPIAKHAYGVFFNHKLEVDWKLTVKFIAQHVKPLSRLTIFLDMCYEENSCYFVGVSLDKDKVVRRLRKLKGLRGLFVHLSRNRDSRGSAREEHNRIEELRLERLAMNEDTTNVSTEDELESKLEE